MKLLLRVIGATSLILSLWGFDYLAESVQQAFIYPVHIPGAPLFQQVFWTMTALDAIFLVAIAFASIGLLRLKRNAVRIYTWLYIALMFYVFAPGAFWESGPLRRSIAAASGVGAIPLAPLILFPIPFVYAVVSVLLVNLAARKIGNSPIDISDTPGSLARSS
ncbi:MAG TPA: hypothetical protein VIB39_19195 [Candidatus Angelobacter sp.]|jgi:hypothetical protein